MRKRSLTAAESPAPPTTPHVIEPNGLYFLDEAKRLMRWRASTARREIRSGRLKVSKRGGRYYLLGKWLIEWIEGGAIKPRRLAPCACGEEVP